MRGGQENKKAADGGERAKARRSSGTTKGSSWSAPRAGLSRVLFLPQQSDGKAAISGHHRQPATARPVDHRPFARSLWSRLQPASASRLHSQGRSSTRLDNRATPASDRHPTGPRLGRWTDYCGPAKAGSGRDRHRGKSRKGGAGVQARGAGRCAGRSLERGPGQRTGCGIQSTVKKKIFIAFRSFLPCRKRDRETLPSITS